LRTKIQIRLRLRLELIKNIWIEIVFYKIKWTIYLKIYYLLSKKKIKILIIKLIKEVHLKNNILMIMNIISKITVDLLIKLIKALLKKLIHQTNLCLNHKVQGQMIFKG
jgi:hypothetical protein